MDDKQYVVEQLQHLQSSSGWKILVDKLEDMIKSEERYIMIPIDKNKTKEEKDRIHEYQENRKSVVESWRNVIELPQTLCDEYSDIGGFSTTMIQ